MVTPYYSDPFIRLYHGDSREILPQLGRLGPTMTVTDPPYNIGYGYESYQDRLTESEYAGLLCDTITLPAVVIHYPEPMFLVANALIARPEKVVSWVYNANTPRQWRTIAWFGIKPDLSLVRQPYKNPTDRRVKQLMEGGAEGPPIYDWWHIDQVKNVSDEKTTHPCQIPLELMRRILQVTPSHALVIDPFAGAGTTLRAAKDLGRPAIGIEMDEAYCELTARRMGQEVLGLV
jgi:DNA modification methylase